jgi:hypothetical protein
MLLFANDDACLLQLFESFGEHGWRDARKGPLKVAIAMCAQEQFPQNKQYPSFAKKFAGLGYRAKLSIIRQIKTSRRLVWLIVAGELQASLLLN